MVRDIIDTGHQNTRKDYRDTDTYSHKNGGSYNSENQRDTHYNRGGENQRDTHYNRGGENQRDTHYNCGGENQRDTH